MAANNVNSKSQIIKANSAIIIISKIIGTSGVQKLSTSCLNEDAFKSELINTYFGYFEELPCSSKSNYMNIMSFLKTLITDPTVVVKRKHKTAINIKNSINLLFISNNFNALQFDNETRRFFAPDVSHSMKNNIKYFTRLNNAIDSDKFADCFFNYLKTKFNKKWDCTNVPKTTILNDLKTSYVPKVQLFLIENFEKKINQSILEVHCYIKKLLSKPI